MIPQARFSHPESQAGEIWLANVEPGDFDTIGWRTKRLGNKPYDSYGYPLKGGTKRPVMVQHSEAEAAYVAIPVLGAMDLRQYIDFYPEAAENPNVFHKPQVCMRASKLAAGALIGMILWIVLISIAVSLF